MGLCLPRGSMLPVSVLESGTEFADYNQGATGGGRGGGGRGGGDGSYRTKICRHFLMKTCTYGDRCNFSHDTSAMPEAAAPSAAQIQQQMQMRMQMQIQMQMQMQMQQMQQMQLLNPMQYQYQMAQNAKAMEEYTIARAEYEAALAAAGPAAAMPAAVSNAGSNEAAADALLEQVAQQPT